MSIKTGVIKFGMIAVHFSKRELSFLVLLAIKCDWFSLLFINYYFWNQYYKKVRGLYCVYDAEFIPAKNLIYKKERFNVYISPFRQHSSYVVTFSIV